MKKGIVFKAFIKGYRLCISLVLVCVSFCVTPCFGAPMDGLESTFTQPDGVVLTLKFYGDEFYARTETADGYTVVFEPATQTYFYAELSPDGNDFVSTGRAVGTVAPDTLGLRKSIKINPASRAAKAKKRHDEHEAVVKQKERWEAVKSASGKYHALKEEVKKQEKAGKKGIVVPLGTLFPDTEVMSFSQLSAPPASALVDAPEYSPPGFTLSGNVVGLTILVDFSDDPGTAVTQAQVDDYCNKPGFTGWSNKGSIYDYFYAQSASKLRYNNNVTYYVRVPQPKTYYNNTSSSSGTCGRLLLNDALNVLLAKGYDFSALTTKSGGNVRACNVFFAGNNSGVWAQGLWPHRWVLSPSKNVGGGKYIYDYQITNIGSSGSLSIGTFCHENGHMLLGYPDFYDYDGDSGAMSTFTLMASSGSTKPLNIHGYLKFHSGWLDPIELYGAATPVRCAIRADGDTIYKYTNPLKTTEYFMCENRGQYGWESGSPMPDSGLLITHNDQGGNRDAQNMTEALHYETSVEQADGLFELEYNLGGGDNTDLFHSGGTGPATRFDDTTLPNAKWWAGADGTPASGSNSLLTIHSVSVAGATMTFVYGEGTPAASPIIGLDANAIFAICNYGANAASETFGLFNAGGGTLTYTISDDQDWLSCSPASGTATNESDSITINFATSGLAAGSYAAIITVTDPAATPTTKTLTVNLTVMARPILKASPTSLSPVSIVGVSGPTVSFNLFNTGGGYCSYTVAKTKPWLTLSLTNGTVASEIDVIYATCNATSLTPGTYTDTITITSATASNSPLAIPVTLRVLLLGGSDIALTGNGLLIAPSNTTPTVARGTDYGVVAGPVERTFVILNQSDVTTLGLTNSPRVTVSSPSGYFALSQDAASASLAPGASNSFKVTYSPLAGGIHSATVTVASTDSALPRYSFALSGIFVGMPAVSNSGAGPAEQGSATLTGRLTAGGVANLYLCWGATDGGTSSTGSWAHVVALGTNIQNAVFTNQVTGLLYGIQYDCRVYATNASGSAWSTVRTFAAAPPQTRLAKAGLISGTLSGATINTTTPNPGNGDGNAVTNMGPWRAKSNTGWGDNITFVYTGQMYFDGTDYFFVEGIDDAAWLKIDGTVYINNGAWNVTTSSGLISKPQGWYDFELRLFNATGGSGYYNLNPGFQYHKGGGTSMADVDNVYPEDPGNATLFRTAYVVPSAANSISNTIADNITATTADLHGLLQADQSVFTVTVFWSTNNNANATAWLADTSASAVVAGTYTNIANQLIAVTATSMPQASAYYFTMRASNEVTNMWAGANGSFYKIATPAVTTSTGASAITASSATLRGTLAAGGVASAWFCWGDNDAGLSSTSAWDHVQSVGSVNQGTVFSTTVTGLATNRTYFYRCFVTNTAGADWSDTATSFSGVPSVGNAGGGYRMQIAFPSYNKTEPLTNFPALVVLSNGMAGTTFNFNTFLSTNGHDLRFTDSTGSTNLNYEIDTWSTGTRSSVWVQVPNFTNNCSIWATWGNPSQASQPVYTTNGATWGNGYVGVWHMSQSNALESTRNRYNGVASGNTNCIGFVGGAQAFRAGNQLNVATLPFTNNAVSIEAWVQHRTVTSTVQNYFRFNSETAVLRQGGNGELHFYVKNGSGFQHVSVPGQITVGPWSYLAGTFNGSQRAYKNGLQVGSASPGGTLVTGASAFMGMSTEPMDGTIEEVRLSSVARSANWLWASYMSMASNAVFNTIGTVQSPIANLAPTAITNTSALLNAALSAPASSYAVIAYWGLTDGGTNAGAWANSALVGSWTNVASTNIAYQVNGLLPARTYYYTFRATNSQTTAWARPSWQFATTDTDGSNSTVTVVSAYGGAKPGTTVTNVGSVLSFSLTNSPVIIGTTQYVAKGAAVVGNSYTQVSLTNITLTLTNNATLTWAWATNYWLAVATNGAGSVNVVSAWQGAGSNVAITATASSLWLFTGWSGATNGCSIVGNVLTAAMSQARSITANFVLLTPPVVNNAAGATNQTATSATLQGLLIAGTAANAWICWGDNDAGLSSTSAWDHVQLVGSVNQGTVFSVLVTGLATNRTYFYRCFVTNAAGTDWSDTAQAFSGTPAGSVGGEVATAGWSYAPWTGDADSGISSNYTYMAKHCFGNNHSNVTVNGVVFTENFTTSGTGWSLAGTVANWEGDDNGAITGNSELLAQEFVYNGNPRTMTFTGLTIGTTYKATFFSVAWETGVREQTFSVSGGSSSNINQDVYGDNNGITISCVYKATSTSQLFTITPLSASTFHMYALANREVQTGGAIQNLAPTGITNTTATLNAVLSAPASSYTVLAYWGLTDGGTNAGAWANSALVGSWTNVASTNIAYQANGLSPATTYYYTFRATNSQTTAWASPSWQFAATGTNVTPATVAVPNVVGLPQATAAATIVASNLVVGTVSTQYNAGVPAGNVISQNPSGGASVAQNSLVNLVVSLGPQLFSVTYLQNGADSGTAPVDARSPYTSGSSVAVLGNSNGLVKAGYTFAGWNTAANGSGASYAPAATFTISANMTLYAKWTVITYTVSYNANSATSGTAPASQTKTNAVSLTLATNSGALARTGYYLVGWNTATNGIGISYRSGGTYTANTAATLYAEWSIDEILFRDDFNTATSNSLTAPATRATGSLAGAVTYTWSSSTGVAVDGLLNWDSNTNRNTNNEQTDATGTQNLRITYDFGPSVSGKVWEVTFSQRVAWSHPLTFGVADTVQNGAWDAWDNVAYDFAVGSYGAGLRYDVDAEGGGGGPTVASVFPSPANTTDFHHFRIRFNEPASAVTVWVNGTQKVSLVSLDFESAGRFLSWGEPGNFGGALDNLVVKIIKAVDAYGIPDSWKDTYGLVGGNRVALADPDGDGLNNLEEYLAGTDPMDVHSVLAITDAYHAAGTNFVLRWPSVASRLYSVDRSTNLLGGWLSIKTHIIATPPLNVYTDAPPVAPSIFYKIKVQ